MEKYLKPITTGNSNFKELIEHGNIYVDKTRYLLDLIEGEGSEKYYFLSRPRRFGKSLTVDTLLNIFSGNKYLFESLYIYDKYCFDVNPVIKINLNNVSVSSLSDFLTTLKLDVLYPIAQQYGVDGNFPLGENIPSLWMNYIISAVSEKYKRQVVILIDEYDYPLLDSIHDDVFSMVRDSLESFFSVLKAREEDIKFCFITGITRFSQVSLFSKLNNLVDISDDPRYASICGYTDQELDYYFSPYMEKYYQENGVSNEDGKADFRNRIRSYYDGYRFSPRSAVCVYNPVSIGFFFKRGCFFDNFWVTTGSQRLVREIVSLYPSYFEEGDVYKLPSARAKSFEVRAIFSGNADRTYVYSYLLQAGYLTIRDEKNGVYELSYPNEEVRDAISASVLNTYGLSAEAEMVRAVRTAFREGCVEDIIDIYRNFFSSFPYDLFLDKERGYQIAFFSSLKTIGLEARAEEHTSIGRMDISVRLEKYGQFYAMELKLDDSAENALAQIKDRKYHEIFEQDGCVIHLVGINFSSEKRNIESWCEEVLNHSNENFS